MAYFLVMMWFSTRSAIRSASHLLQNWVPLKLVAELMGISYAMIDKVYGHLMPNKLKPVVDRLSFEPEISD